MDKGRLNRRMQPAGPIIPSELIYASLLEMAVLVHLHQPPCESDQIAADTCGLPALQLGVIFK